MLLIPAVVLVSTAAVPAPLSAEALLTAAARTASIAAATYVAASLIPHVLFTVAASRYRELFVLAVVALVLALAVGAQQLGLSLALAAFLAGLAVSESELAHQILAEVLPVRHVFSVLFFASLGMLLDPRFVADHVGPIAAILVVVMLVKAGLVLGVVRLFGYSFRTALLAGVGLAQIGEFSFVLARAGLDQGLVPPDLMSLTVTVALISMLTTPFAFRLGDTLLRAAAGWPWFRPLVQPEPREAPPAGVEAVRGHAVVCGAGEVGRAIVLALRARGFPVVAVDNDPQRAAELRREGVPVVYGDAGNPHVLAHANLGSARVLALAVPDPVAAEAAVRAARRLNPDVDIIARVSHDEAAHLLREPGVDEVVHPKLEAGLEMLRHDLVRYGVPPADALAEVQWRRAMHYRKEWPGHGRP
jgi:CPA2 family monovalent cation:H+ antiporter-2